MISKKKGLRQNRRLFLAEITNLNVFSGQNQVISKKKRSSPKSEGFFWPKSEIQNQVISKKKKVFTEIRMLFLAEITNSNVFSGQNQQLFHPQKIPCWAKNKSGGGKNENWGGKNENRGGIAPCPLLATRLPSFVGNFKILPRRSSRKGNASRKESFFIFVI